MSANKKIRVLFSIILSLLGFVFISNIVKWNLNHLILNIGQALLVAGVVSIFHELFLLKSEIGEYATKTKELLFNDIRKAFPSELGIKTLHPKRLKHPDYLKWAINEEPKAHFFAGRSVLHRMDRNFREFGFSSLQDVIQRRLSQNSSINFLLLDPRSNLIDRLAKEEGQKETEFLEDLWESITICNSIYEQSKKLGKVNGSLTVRLYDEVPYFAYHQAGNETILGFYFASNLGHKSAAYIIDDEKTDRYFRNHFHTLFERSNLNTILKTTEERICLDRELYNKLSQFFLEKLPNNRKQ